MDLEMPQVNLTAKALESLKLAGEGQLEYWDTTLKGFGVRLSKRGVSHAETKTFFVRYRVGKRMRRLTIGDVHRVSLADARVKARSALVSVDDGEDPAVERIASRRAETFGELWSEYLERHAKQNKRSWRDDERIATVELLPHWESRKAKDITRSDARLILDAILDRKAPIMANRTLALARKVFNFGLERDLIESNPCHKIKPPAREQSRERVLTDDELRSFWTGLGREEEAGRYLVAAFYRTRLLTAQRGREVLRMRWSDIAEERSGVVWTIPADVTKNRRSHRVPLSGAVVRVLKAVQAEQEKARERANKWREMKGEPARLASEWVFPSPRGTVPMANTHKAFDRIRSSCGGPNYTAHDLRRTAATRMTGDLKIPRFTVGRVLNHIEPGVTGVYDRYAYDDERRNALGRWAQHLTNSILKDQKPSRRVFPFREMA
jgi:integrase